MKRKKAPADLLLQISAIPAFWAKFRGVRAVYACLSMHVIGRPANARSAPDQYGRLAVRAAATGKERPFRCDSDVDGELRI